MLSATRMERLRREAEALAGELPDAATFECDVSSDEQIDAVFAKLKDRYGKLDILVHWVAFAPADALQNDFLLTSRDAFRVAHEISVYSLIALSRAAAPLMTDGGSIMTMTYYGSQKVVPRYNVMGVAKAALEATVRYLAADLGRAEDSGQCDFRWTDQDAGGARDWRVKRKC